jgi:adenylate cyclase
VASELRDFVLRPLGRFQLFGKRQALSIFELMGLDREASDPSMLAAFAEALRDFSSQRWAEAAAKFAAILAERPTDGPAKFYLARCRRYQDETRLPADPTLVHLDHK